PRKARRFHERSIGRDWLISDSLPQSMKPAKPLRPVPRFLQFAISRLPPTRPPPPRAGIRTARRCRREFFRCELWRMLRDKISDFRTSPPSVELPESQAEVASTRWS